MCRGLALQALPPEQRTRGWPCPALLLLCTLPSLASRVALVMPCHPLSPAEPWGWEALTQRRDTGSGGSPIWARPQATGEQLVRFNWLKRASTDMGSHSCPPESPGRWCSGSHLHCGGVVPQKVRRGRSRHSHHSAKSGRASSCLHPLPPLAMAFSLF